MRFSRIQMIIITLCFFAMGTGFFHYIISQQGDMGNTAIKDSFDDGEIVETGSESVPKEFPLKKSDNEDKDGEQSKSNESSHSQEHDSPDTSLIDPNVASKEKLLEVKGFYAALVDEIIHQREEGTRFYSLQDLGKVEGMTAELLNQAKAFLTFPTGGLDTINNELPLSNDQETSPQKLISAAPKAVDSRTGKSGGKININTASSSLLQTLPKIGEKTAARIIEYREKNGYFKSIDQIKNVKGIGSKTFDKMKDLITVDK